MRDIILNFQKQIEVGRELAKDSCLPAGTVKLDREYKRVIFCGMGGSIIPAEIFVLYAGHNHLDTHYEIWKGYDIPTRASQDDLIVCMSWSGTTEETISSCQKAISKNLPLIVITKGGPLGELAKQNNLKTIILPQENIPPRFATGYMTAVLFSIFGYDKELEINLDPEKLESMGKETAQKIGNSIPLIYSSFIWRKLPAFWKILLNENSKIHAFSNTFPRLVHNELVGFSSGNKIFYPILFMESDPDPRIKKNYDAAIAIFNRLGYNYSIIDLDSSNLAGRQAGKLLETVFNNYILGLWTSYYLANKLGVNVEDIKLIDEFKQLKQEL